MLEMKQVSKVFHAGTPSEKVAINSLDLTVRDGDFITVIGGNGAGKSTLLGLISGAFACDGGQLLLDGMDITRMPEHKRAKYLGRVFQDPMMGTAIAMSIEENLAMARRRTRRRGLVWGVTRQEKQEYRDLVAPLELGLEDRMAVKVGQLSGGQRQAITLLMATVEKPRLLLLDEHTAALDPKTAAKVLALTDELVQKHQLTTIMITHNMKDALRLGNRLIMMDAGRILFEASGEEKKRLTVPDLLALFERASGQEMANDRMILA